MTIFRPGRPVRLPAVTVAVAALVATTLAASSNATARELSTPAARTGSIKPVELTGMNASSYSVTLPTGDQVTLTAAGSGRYTVTATPSPATSPAISVRVQSRSNGKTMMSAVPVAAEGLITSGALDRNLFDVAWLAAHGDTGPTGRIPVTVQYAGRQTTATLSSKVTALDGATLVSTDPGAGSVELSVDAARAATFWAALTGQHVNRQAAGHGQPRLAGGATRAWPTGDRTAAAPRAAVGQPTFHVAEIVKRSKGDIFGCNKVPRTTLCEPFTTLYGVAGGGSDTGYVPTSINCVDADPCTTYRVAFNVPAGVYYSGGYSSFYADQRWQNLGLINPQFTVAGDTTFTIDVDKAQQLAVTTPRLTQTFSVQDDRFRSAVDGSGVEDLMFTSEPTYWQASPDVQVTAGTYHEAHGVVLGKPQLTMAVTSPQRLDLDVSYWTYHDAQTAGTRGAARFNGQRSTQIVDAGYGRAEDFAHIDARGKVALVRITAWESSKMTFFGCGSGGPGVVMDEMLNNAIQAGAIAVLVDPSDPAKPGDWCGGLIPESNIESEDPVKIPFAQIPVPQANRLIGLLAHGAVHVGVSGYAGNSPYLYSLRPYFEGGTPTPAHLTVTDAQLARVTEHYHADQPSAGLLGWAEWSPNENLVGESTYEQFAAPTDFTLYRGPASPSNLHLQEGSPPNYQSFYDVLEPAGSTSSTDWNTDIAAPGTHPVADCSGAAGQVHHVPRLRRLVLVLPAEQHVLPGHVPAI